MEEYYHILGIGPDSNNADIKRAYRRLALEYHPDRNQSEDARERFLKITEAYEILTGTRKLKNPFKKYYNRKETSQYTRSRKAAQERARRQAAMQYEEFCKNNKAFQQSWYFQPTKALVVVIYFFGWAFGFFLMLAPLFAGVYIHLKGGYWWQGILCLPLILAGLLVIHQCIRLKKEASPYFTPPQSNKNR